MRVCIPSLDPGGPNGQAAPSFEDTEVFDFFEVHADGSLDYVAQTRPCVCWGPNQAEAIARRGIEAIVVGGISSGAYLMFKSMGVRILKADGSSTALLLKSYAEDRLRPASPGRPAKPRMI